MAGDWIKMRADLLTHPKVVRMASALKADRLRVVGGLFAVWCLFDAHSVDGHLEGYTDQVLDDLVGFPGFAAGMRGIGWLELTEDSLVTPRFDEHNGQSAKRRATEAQRKRDERKTSALDADKKRTREEKRREDIKPPTEVKRATKKCPTDFFVTDEMREWAARECPGVDVAKATAKFADNTFKAAKTDWPATWRNWLRSDQERIDKDSALPAWRTEQRERTQKAAPGVAVGGAVQFFEAEVKNVTPIALG